MATHLRTRTLLAYALTLPTFLASASASSAQVLTDNTDLLLSPTLLAEKPAAGIGPATGEPMRRRLGGVRIPFVSNSGQVDPEVAYYAATFAGTVYVTKKGEIVYSLPAPKDPEKTSRPGAQDSLKATGKSWSMTERPVGGKTRVTAERSAEAQVSYFIGKDPNRWRSGIATHETVGLGEVWPGVRLSLQAHGNNVEKLFTVAPGADPSRIRMRVAGVRSLRVNEAGALVASTGLGEVTFTRPVAYQERDGVRRAVTVAYRAKGRQYGFTLSAHDPTLPVVIDPLLKATYLGGSGSDFVTAVAIHPTTGEVFVAGGTASPDFPGTTGGAQPDPGPGFDAFVARLNATLTTLNQATYLGGAGGVELFGFIAIHPTTGEVFVTGRTSSTDFPGTTGGAQPANGGGVDAFVARLNASLTTLNQATYLGGSLGDGGSAIAIHPTTGEVFVTGAASSDDFPGTTGGAQSAIQGDGDAFVARLNASLTTLNQATYLGGSGDEVGFIAIHPTTGEVFVTGTTDSPNFPGTTGGAQPAFGGGEFDAFVARLNATLTTLNQATYLGGSLGDEGLAIAIHSTPGEVFVAGSTGSTDFPGTTGGAQPAKDGGNDAFVARLDATLTTLNQATYLGGSLGDEGLAIAIQSTTGEVFVAGVTNSTDFPGTTGGAQPAFGGGIKDAFVARLTATLTTLNQATYLGGSGVEIGLGFADLIPIAIHPTTGEVFVAGFTSSTNFPGTTGGAQPAYGGGDFDGFVARLTPDLTGRVVVNNLVTLVSLVTSFDPTPVDGGPAGTFTITAIFTNTGSITIEDPIFLVTQLSGGNLLLNADGGPGGVGALLTPDVGADGILSPHESVTTGFVIGLQAQAIFTFFVDLLGVPQS